MEQFGYDMLNGLFLTSETLVYQPFLVIGDTWGGVELYMFESEPEFMEERAVAIDRSDEKYGIFTSE